MQTANVRCLCCGSRTLTAPGVFDLCPVCWWLDDGQDESDADVVRGGPNGALSLTAARANFLACGAADPRFLAHVRAPLASESAAGQNRAFRPAM
ncbi:MAG TPA: CPCC family cysteine-rich protein [Acidobacteriaceae bacterium]